jgi:hypothetical protein
LRNEVLLNDNGLRSLIQYFSIIEAKPLRIPKTIHPTGFQQKNDKRAISIQAKNSIQINDKQEKMPFAQKCILTFRQLQ